MVFSSVDHNLERQDEIERIGKSNGVIVERLYVKRVTPSRDEFSEEAITKQRLALNMSRSLGHVTLGRFGVQLDIFFFFFSKF